MNATPVPPPGSLCRSRPYDGTAESLSAPDHDANEMGVNAGGPGDDQRHPPGRVAFGIRSADGLDDGEECEGDDQDCETGQFPHGDAAQR